MSTTIKTALYFFSLLFLQAFLFRQVGLGFGEKTYVFIFVLPLFVATLPLRTPPPLVVLGGFALGLASDIFYETLGLHAAAGTFVGYVRQFILGYLEPKDGYKARATTTGRLLGRNWWAGYLGALLASYCLFYFSIEAFSHVYWQDILLKTVGTLPVSFLVCSVFVVLLQPRL